MQGLQGALLDFSLIALPSMVIGVFLGPAFSRVARAEAFGIPLEEIRAEADAVAGRGEAPTRTRRAAANNDESDNLVLWVGGVLIVVTLYLTYRVQILIALLLLAGSISAVALVVLLVASRRGVVARTYGRTVAFLVPLLFSAVGLVTVVFLWDPPAGGAVFTEFVDHFNRSRGFASLEGLGFVVYQVLGGACFVALALGSLCFSLANLSAVYIAVDAWGQWVWRATYWLVGGFGRPSVPLLLLPLAAMALLLAGGWVYGWVTDLAFGEVLPSSLVER